MVAVGESGSLDKTSGSRPLFVARAVFFAITDSAACKKTDLAEVDDSVKNHPASHIGTTPTALLRTTRQDASRLFGHPYS